MSKPLLYDYITKSGNLVDLENLIYANLTFIEDMDIKKAVSEIQKFYESLNRRTNSVSGDDLRLIVIILYNMHNSLVRIIRKRFILDFRELQHNRSTESAGESKLPDNNSYLLNSLVSLEKLPDDVLNVIRDFSGEDGLSPDVKVAALLDLEVLKNLQFLIKNLMPMYEIKKDDALRGLQLLAERVDKLVDNYKVLGFDTSPVQGTALMLGRKNLRF